MKKIIFILTLFVSFVANAQYTPPTGYTNINSRYDWLAGVFRALGLPAGGNAAFTTGQAQRAGSVYYDSTGGDAGLKVWNGAAWVGVGEVTQSALDDTAAAIRGDFYTDADARAAISLTTTGTSGAATYNSATGVFNIPNYQGGLSEVIAGYGLLNVNDSTLDVDSLLIANRDWVMDRIAEIDTSNLLFDSLGAAGISPMTTWNNTLYARRISVSGGSIDTTASGGLLITVTGGGGTPAGSNTEIQFNNAGSFGASPAFKWDGSKLDLWSGNAPGMLIGGDLGAITRTDATNKYGKIAGIHYTNAEEPIALLSYSASSGTNSVQYGLGVNPGLNGASSHTFYTSTTNTTLGGLERFTINASTKIQVNAILANYDFQVSGDADANALYVDASEDAIGIGTVTPTAWLHLKAGTTAQPPFKFTSGTNLTTAEAGSMEYDGTHYYLSPSTTRKKIPLVDNSTATNGFLPIGNGTDFTLAAITEGQNINVTNGAGSITVAGPTLTKNAMVENPTASENIFMFRTPVTITVTDVTAVLVGGTPSVTYNIAFGTDRTSGTNVYTAGQTVTSETTGTAASGVNDATIPAGSWVWITTSAATDVTQLNISLTYTED